MCQVTEALNIDLNWPPVSWSFPRAPRAMDRQSLWRISRRSRHSRLFDLGAARTWWAPWRNGLHGALVGRVVWVRCCLARGSQAGNDSKTGCSLQDSPALVPTAHNVITHPRFILYIRPPSPQAPRPSPKPLFEYSETA